MMKLPKTFLRGSIPPLITPFRNGKVDYDAYAGLVEFQVKNGSHGILVNGTTSEPASLTVEERNRLVDVANTLWGERGLQFQIAPSLELNEDDKKLRVHVPQIADATWAKDNLSYRFGTHVYLLPLTGKVKRRKKGDSVELTWE